MSKSKEHVAIVRDILLLVVMIAALEVAAVYLGLVPNPANLSRSCTHSEEIAIAIASESVAITAAAAAAAGLGVDARQLVGMGQAHHQFVHFSSYRESFTTFYVVGLNSRLIHDFDKPVSTCLWVPSGQAPGSSSEVNTTAVVNLIRRDEHDVPYRVVVIKCQFDIEVGADDLGGNLSLTVSAGPPVGKVHRHEVFEEKAGTNFAATKAGPFPYKYSFCSAPILGPIHEDWMHHWLVYHLSLMDGQAHFFFHNMGGISDEARAILQPFIKAGFVTITDVINDQVYPSFYRSQVLVLNDCLHRTRFLSQWTFFFDFDEFIYLQPPLTLAGLLDQNANATVLTLGSWPMGTSHCRAPKSMDEWPVERMVFRKKPGPECKKPEKFSIWFCPDLWGRRKMILNPRKVFAGSVHGPWRLEHGELRDLNASTARLNHFRTMLPARARPCTVTWNLSVQVPQVYESLYVEPEETLSEAIAYARKSVPRLYLS